MKLSKILFAACAMLAINASAGVNLSNYLGAAVPANEAKAVLGKVFMHDLSMLDRMVVEVADMQERKNGVKVVFFYVGRMSTQMNTELYAMSFDSGWNAVDGMMLGYTGDTQCVKVTMPEGYYIETQPDMPYSIVADTLGVERTYRYGTSIVGKYFNQLGTLNSYYLIGPNGIFTQLPTQVSAVESHGDVNAPGGNEPVSGEVEGLYSILGVKLLDMAHKPISAKFDMNELNKLAKDFVNLEESSTDEPSTSASNINVSEFARWSTALGLRNAEPFLTWIAKNKGKEAFSNFMSRVIAENEFKEASWLKAMVPTLKDKKARQWWQKWLTEKGR